MLPLLEYSFDYVRYMEQSEDHQRTKAMPIRKNTDGDTLVMPSWTIASRRKPDSVLYVEVLEAIPRNSLYVKVLGAIYGMLKLLLYEVSPRTLPYTAVLRLKTVRHPHL
jgi:hypothetical protein